MGKIIRPLVRIYPTENIQERIRAVSYFGNFVLNLQNYNARVTITGL